MELTCAALVPHLAWWHRNQGTIRGCDEKP